MNIRSSMIWDILSVMVLAATAVVLLIYGIIFFQPNVGFNVFAPESLPEVVVLATSTPTVRAFKSITPTIYHSATSTATITKTPTITNTQPTSTITNTPTITGTLPTITPSTTPTLSPTISRTSTRTVNPAILTDIARTRISGTRTQAVQETNQAATNARLRLTQNVIRTENAALTQTQAAANATATVFELTATQGAQETATQVVVETATMAVAQTSTSVVVTEQAVQTRTEQASIELVLPIAYSVNTDGDTNTAEEFIIQRLGDGTIETTLNMGVAQPGAYPASGWTMGETTNHYLLFSEPSPGNLSPIYRVLYTTTNTIDHLVNDLGQFITDIVVNKQTENFEDRTLAFSYASGGFNTDRNIWIMKYDTVNFNPPQWANNQLTADNTNDEHSPHWVRNSGSGYEGYVMYVSGPVNAPENIRLIPPTGGASQPLTFYDSFTTREISAPKWCTGHDWDNGVPFHRVVFGMRTSATDDWDLYLADPMQLLADGNNDSIIRLTDTTENEYAPDWSPFCNRVTYLSDFGGNTNVWTFSVTPSGALSDVAQLTNNALMQMSPLWQPYIP